MTSDLDEFAIAALAAAPVDSYGVGTSVVTGSGAPTAGFVYKLVAVQDEGGDWASVAKKSAQKKNLGGRKQALRRHDEDGVAIAEVVTSGRHQNISESDRDLIEPLVIEGNPVPEHLGEVGTKAAREHHRFAKVSLPLQAHRLTRGEPCVPTQLG